MNMMKKIASVCAAIACMASMAACGQKNEPAAQQGSTPAETAATTAAETEAVTETTTEATTEPTTLPEKEEDKKKKELINSFAPDGKGNFELLSDGEVPDKYSIKVNNEILSASHPVTLERLQRAGWLTFNIDKIRFFDNDKNELFGIDGLNYINEQAMNGTDWAFIARDNMERKYDGFIIASDMDAIDIYKYNSNELEPKMSLLTFVASKSTDDIPKENIAEKYFVTSKALMQHFVPRGYWFRFKDDLSDGEKKEISDTYEYYGGLRFFKSTRDDVHKALGDKYVDGTVSSQGYDDGLTENDEIYYDDIEVLPTDKDGAMQRSKTSNYAADYRYVVVHYDENGTLAAVKIVVPESYALENADLS